MSSISDNSVRFLSGDEAVAEAAKDAGVVFGSGYPGTPSTEILEHFSTIGGNAEWSPNEKTAYETALGVAFAGTRALVTMKHVGLNVAADPFFTSAYTGVKGGFVVVSADDPGMASSQNEQDNRHYAIAAGVPMLEPSDSQEAYDFTLWAYEISEKWNTPVLLRMTTRVCHSYSIVKRSCFIRPPAQPEFNIDVKSQVMIPAYARLAHRKLRTKLAQIKEWNEDFKINTIFEGDSELGIITSGVTYQHVREAAPTAKILKLGMTYPLPEKLITSFVNSVKRCLVIEEGDPWLETHIKALGLKVDGKPEIYRFGELNVGRVRRILQGNTEPEQQIPAGKPPQLCEGCSHRVVFEALKDLNCIVAGDIGCYTLGTLPPYEALHTCVCMGGAITIGLGLRHALPEEQASKVVSVIGDSTFIHSGITGLIEMIYNPPATGHLVIILDNSTTAMTGHQEHPGTGRTIDHQPTGKVVYEDLAKALGIGNVHVFEVGKDSAPLKKLINDCLQSRKLSLIIARRPCILVAKRIRELESKSLKIS
jgi:indolepyruvate ferredoxin oxidoreductase alpha subunit